MRTSIREELKTLAVIVVFLSTALLTRAQTVRSSQIVIRCMSSSKVSGANSAVLYRKCSDGKVYLSSGGGDFVEVATSTTISPPWQTRAFSAGNYTANGAMTWTVQSGDVKHETWQFLNESTVLFKFYYGGSSTGGTPNTQLKVALPFTSALDDAQDMIYTGALGDAHGYASFAAGSNVMTLYRTDFSNWSNQTDSIDLVGTVTLKVP